MTAVDNQAVLSNAETMPAAPVAVSSAPSVSSAVLQGAGQRLTVISMANWRAGLARRNSPVATIGRFLFVIMNPRRARPQLPTGRGWGG
jgi:hypothetical protein